MNIKFDILLLVANIILAIAVIVTGPIDTTNYIMVTLLMGVYGALFILEEIDHKRDNDRHNKWR